MAATHIRTKIILTLFAAIGSLLAAEFGVRVYAAVQQQATLEDVGEGVRLPTDGQAALGHFIVRSANRRLVYQLRPNIEVTYEGQSLSLNEYGFRGPSVAPGPHEGVFRIVGLGDSFMFGHGVAEGEYYLANLAERCREAQTDPPVEVVNLAVPGYNTTMEVACFRERGLAFKPDMVIIDFVGNDITLPNFMIEAPDPWSFDRLFLVELVRAAASGTSPEADREGPGPTDPVRRQGLTGIPKPTRIALRDLKDSAGIPEEYRDIVGWDAYRRSLAELGTLAEKEGFRLVSVSLAPNPPRLHAFAIARELGIEVLDIGALFQQYMEEHGHELYLGSPLAISSKDGHPSVMGHRLAGEVLFAYLLDNGLLGGRSR